MRVNVYAEEMSDRIEIIAKVIDGHQFTGLRFYEATVNVNGDDDSAAVTFWGERDLRELLRVAIARLDTHYGSDSPHAS